MKIAVSILYLFSISFTVLHAQTSPVKWLVDSVNINVDNSTNHGYYANEDDLKFTFINTGTHVTFVDTTIFYRKVIAKPDDTLSFTLSSNRFKLGHALWKKRDTVASIFLPFYYEGKIYREKVTCILTFGKSKLIEHDDLKIDATKKVTQFVHADTSKRQPSLTYKHYFTIKNTSKQPIFCTKELIAYNDSPELRNRTQIAYIEILPGNEYKIPAKLHMDKKYNFKCAGKIVVFSEKIREEYPCEIISKFDYTKLKEEY